MSSDVKGSAIPVAAGEPEFAAMISGPRDGFDLRKSGVRVGILVVTLGSWELGVRIGLINPFFVSSPIAIVKFIGNYLASEEGQLDVLTTVKEMMIGFALATSTGLAGGLLLARFQKVREILRPFVNGFQAMPHLPMIPIFILWFGIGSAPKIALIISSVFFFMLISTEGAIAGVDQEYLTTVRGLGATQRQLSLKVILPGALPGLFAAIRLAIAYSMLGAVVGEMIAAQYGLGRAVTVYQNSFKTDGVLGIVVIVSGFAVLLNEGLGYLQRKLLAWNEE